jgi:outer membrane lipoprotein-sorting protein
MRVMRRSIWLGLFVAGVVLAGGPTARSQTGQVLLPDQSAAKAKQLLNQTIRALGGDAYLNLKDSTCIGRWSQFGHSGEVMGYEKFYDYTKLPDKERTEFSSKRNIIQVFNGDHGWIMDRGGVQDAPEDSLAERKDDMQKGIDNVLRYRIKEPGMIFRYAGPDIVDLKEADWVELVDKEGRTIRLALDRATHLPLRKEVITRNPNTRLRVREVEVYSNYHPIQNLQTPFQVAAERNGFKTSQIFIEECQYNTGLDDSLFTKESLDERWKKVGKKEKKRK